MNSLMQLLLLLTAGVFFLWWSGKNPLATPIITNDEFMKRLTTDSFRVQLLLVYFVAVVVIVYFQIPPGLLSGDLIVKLDRLDTFVNKIDPLLDEILPLLRD